MLTFEKITADNIRIVAPYLIRRDAAFCDYTAATLFMWAKYYNFEYAVCDDVLIIKSLALFAPREIAFMPPFGDLQKGVALVKEYCAHCGKQVLFSPVSQQKIAEFEKIDGFSHAEKIENWSDYVYLRSDFANVEGKKFAHKRNHVHNFEKAHPEAQFVPLCDGNVDEVVAFLHSISHQSLQSAYELTATVDFVANRDKFEVLSGVLYADNRVCGVTLGEAVGDTLDVHTERADKDVEGSFEAIAHYFARANPTFTYLNREEDMGIEGLRIAKEKWRPCFMLDKFNVFMDNI